MIPYPDGNIPATTALAREVLTWARENGVPVGEGDARSWDEWPHGHESHGMAALARGGRYNRLSARLVKLWQDATGRQIKEKDNSSPRTGDHTAYGPVPLA